MATTQDIPTIGLALQGGGAHAAFTWGVLDRLLDEVERGMLSIVAISGASGGALNAAACTYGLSRSPADAKRALEQLWTLVGAASKNTPSSEFFRALRQAGHATASTWVRDCLPSVGKTSTFDLDTLVKSRVKGTPGAMRSVQQAEGKTL